ncbi:biopolymer transporter ExbD [Roseobacter denitrificans]|nr:biopolymer transporter ExbD [Roseobacter denitrificans]
MTPLVDVIFLLLLFFMLTSTFSKFGEIDITAAAGGSGESARGAKFLQITEDELRLSGVAVDIDALADSLSDERVFVSLHTDIKAQRMIDVLVVLRSIPNISMTVLR